MKTLFILAILSVCLQDNDETAKLRNDLANAQRELRTLRAQIARAESAGYHRSDKGMASALPMIKALPDDLSPRKNPAWDAIELGAVNKFLSDSYIGTQFTHKAKIYSHSISVNPEYKCDESRPMYIGRISLEYPVLPSRGFSVEQRLRNSMNAVRYQSFTFMGNENLKANFQKLKKGQFIVVEGAIVGVWAKRSKNTISVTVELKQKRHTPAFLNDK